MQKLLTGFLIYSLIGCAQAPKTTKFDGKWAFCEVIPNEDQWACLNQEDVKKLRKALIECQSQNK